MPDQHQSEDRNYDEDEDVSIPGRATKSLPCRYCSKYFRRLEHVQRHERTHTKEKPFACSCGKAFARRDLYVRHAKIAHSGEPIKDTHKIQKSATSNQPTMVAQQQGNSSYSGMFYQNGSTSQESNPYLELPASENIWDVDMHIETDVPMPFTFPAIQPHEGQVPKLLTTVDIAFERPTRDNNLTQSSSNTTASQRYEAFNQDTLVHPTSFGDSGEHALEDYTGFLDHFDSSRDFLPSVGQMDNCLQGLNHEERLSSRTEDMSDGIFGDLESFPHLKTGSSNMENEVNGLEHLQANDTTDSLPPWPPWKISSQDYHSIQANLSTFLPVLGDKFKLPSRHALIRFFEGFITGFDTHFPFVHLPTFSPRTCAPELLLAMAAIGAQYRFEASVGISLWHASRALCQERIKERQNNEQSAFENDDQERGVSSSPNEVSSTPDLSPSFQNSNKSPEYILQRTRLQTIQALLILSAMCAWGTRPLLKNGAALQSQVASLIREEDLLNEVSTTDSSTWLEAISAEERRRTVLIAYCFFNLQMIAYNAPPLILTSEVNLKLPLTEQEWGARDLPKWQLIRQRRQQDEHLIQTRYKELFSFDSISPKVAKISSLGHHVLIHAVIQKVFIISQTGYTRDGTLRPDDLDCLVHGLKRWQIGWEAAIEAETCSEKQDGPIGIDSMALLRLSYTRLHSNIGPCRELETREPLRIISAFKRCPTLVRSPRLGQAVIQAARTLSVPIRIGVDFVARTQTFSWSILHSLCNLESALFLNKWLESLTSTMEGCPITADEDKLLVALEQLLNETEYAPSGTTDTECRLRQLSKAVLTLWAQAFKGTHVFPLASLIGSSLEAYAAELD